MAMSGRLKRGLIAFALFDLFLVVALVSLFLLQSERDTLQELRERGLTLYPEVRELDSFQLEAEDGRTFSNADLVGQWNFFFFGFTSCPDICPLTMAELKQFYVLLDASEQTLAQVIMVSVDPERDTVSAMADYVDSFHEDFVGLTGNYATISSLAAQFFVAHSEPVMESHNDHTANVGNMESDGDYLIEHSGHLAIVDPNGDFAGVMRSPVRNRDLAAVYQELLSR